MDHPNQTMLLPASYAVISEEEMTYLDGGQSIYLGSAFNHDIYFNTDQFATFCQNAAINLFVLMTNYSFRYIAGRVQSGLSNGLSLSGTFYHTWDKMNTWSRIASVGVAGLAGIYVYSQAVNIIRTAKGNVFAEWKNSDTAKLFEDHGYKNKKQSGGYFF